MKKYLIIAALVLSACGQPENDEPQVLIDTTMTGLGTSLYPPAVGPNGVGAWDLNHFPGTARDCLAGDLDDGASGDGCYSSTDKGTSMDLVSNFGSLADGTKYFTAVGFGVHYCRFSGSGAAKMYISRRFRDPSSGTYGSWIEPQVSTSAACSSPDYVTYWATYNSFSMNYADIVNSVFTDWDTDTGALVAVKDTVYQFIYQTTPSAPTAHSPQVSSTSPHSGDTGVNITLAFNWSDAASGNTDCSEMQGQINSGGFASIGNCNTRTWAIPNATEGDTYQVRVKGLGTARYSTAFTISTAALAHPTNLASYTTGCSTGHPCFSWDNMAGNTGYCVYVKKCIDSTGNNDNDCDVPGEQVNTFQTTVPTAQPSMNATTYDCSYGNPDVDWDNADGMGNLTAGDGQGNCMFATSGVDDGTVMVRTRTAGGCGFGSLLTY